MAIKYEKVDLIDTNLNYSGINNSNKINCLKSLGGVRDDNVENFKSYLECTTQNERNFNYALETLERNDYGRDIESNRGVTGVDTFISRLFGQSDQQALEESYKFVEDGVLFSQAFRSLDLTNWNLKKFWDESYQGEDSNPPVDILSKTNPDGSASNNFVKLSMLNCFDSLTSIENQYVNIDSSLQVINGYTINPPEGQTAYPLISRNLIVGISINAGYRRTIDIFGKEILDPSEIHINSIVVHYVEVWDSDNSDYYHYAYTGYPLIRGTTRMERKSYDLLKTIPIIVRVGYSRYDYSVEASFIDKDFNFKMVGDKGSGSEVNNIATLSFGYDTASTDYFVEGVSIRNAQSDTPFNVPYLYSDFFISKNPFNATTGEYKGLVCYTQFRIQSLDNVITRYRGSMDFKHYDYLSNQRDVLNLDINYGITNLEASKLIGIYRRLKNSLTDLELAPLLNYDIYTQFTNNHYIYEIPENVLYNRAVLPDDINKILNIKTDMFKTISSIAPQNYAATKFFRLLNYIAFTFININDNAYDLILIMVSIDGEQVLYGSRRLQSVMNLDNYKFYVQEIQGEEQSDYYVHFGDTINALDNAEIQVLKLSFIPPEPPIIPEAPTLISPNKIIYTELVCYNPCLGANSPLTKLP